MGRSIVSASSKCNYLEEVGIAYHDEQLLGSSDGDIETLGLVDEAHVGFFIGFDEPLARSHAAENGNSVFYCQRYTPMRTNLLLGKTATSTLHLQKNIDSPRRRQHLHPGSLQHEAPLSASRSALAMW
jgi:hypothetical protein